MTTIERYSIDTIPNTLSEFPPLLQRVYAARGITQTSDVERELRALLPYTELTGITAAANLLADNMHKHLLIVGDFDADGATSTAVAVRALRQMGAIKVSFLVPNRFEFGYGLTPEIVDVAAKKQPDLIITVDNGIASVDGVARANALGINVLVTDHHLAGDQLPAAAAIVNPNQPDCQFASKALAGVGVIFYVLLALRAELRQRGWFAERPEVNLAQLLDIVALGTVADVVPLDKNNRILVHQGLQRIRAGKCCAGIQALLTVAKRDAAQIKSSDLGFALGPRLNAAGRLEDMSLGINCLITDDKQQAKEYAERLDSLNHERKAIETSMKEQAFTDLANLHLDEENLPAAICLFDAQWHQGVIGILASRVKDKYHRPTIVFAKVDEQEIKGSARSIPGLHIRDALDSVAKKHPELIKKFGGHAMAAGLSIHAKDFNEFKQRFAEQVAEQASPAMFKRQLLTDGELAIDDTNLTMAKLLQQAGPWGQAFPEPLFDGVFTLLDQRIVGQRHLKCQLGLGDKILPAIAFNIDPKQWPDYRCEKIRIVYRLDVNDYQGVQSLQLMVEHLEKA